MQTGAFEYAEIKKNIDTQGTEKEGRFFSASFVFNGKNEIFTALYSKK